MADRIAWRFAGARDADGVPVEYLGGIPAVNLTEEDFKHLTDEQQEAVRASVLYKAAPERTSRASADDTPSTDVSTADSVT